MRAIHVVAPLVLTLGACQVDPEDPLFIYGTLPDAVGAPEKGRIELWRSTTVAGTWDPATLETPFEFFGDIQADARGDFGSELTYFDTILLQDGGLRDRAWKAVYAPRADLPPVEASFSFYAADVDLPPLRQWDPQLELTQQDGMLRVRMTPPSRILVTESIRIRQSEREDRYGLQLVGEDDEMIWFIPANDAGAPIELPLGLLEDFQVSSQLIATSTGPWAPPNAGLASYQVSYSTVAQTFPKVPLALAAGPVVSRVRGQPCIVTPALSEPVPETLSDCEATNGVLTDGPVTGVEFEEGRPSHLLSIEIPLPAPAQLSWIVARHIFSTLMRDIRVEVRSAADGRWHELDRLRQAELPGQLQGGGFDPTLFRGRMTSGIIQVPASVPEADAVRFSPGDPFSAEELEKVGLWGAVNAPLYLGRATELSVF